MDKLSEQTLLINARRILAECFDEEELRTLCADMQIRYDDLSGSGKKDKARELVAYCSRRRIIPRLISQVLDCRPDALSDFLTEGVFSPIEDTGKIPFEALDRDIYFFDLHRCEMTRYYIGWAEAAGSIDIITLSMQVLLENYGDDRLIEWLMRGKKFRILVLSPASAAAKIRGKEEGIALDRKIVTQIERLKSIYERARQRIATEGGNCSGSLEIRFYDGIPYFAYFGTETEIVIGLYYAQKKGLQSETFMVKTSSPVHNAFQSHFNSLWNGRDEDSTVLEDRVICVISGSKFHFIDLNSLKKAIGKAGRSTAWKSG